MRAFCLISNNGMEKIEMLINEVFDFPERTSYAGGYDFKGGLIICAGSFSVNSLGYYSTTGELHSLLTSLKSCYDNLTGRAKYPSRYLEKDLAFELVIKKTGQAIVSGEYREYPHLPNKLVFQIETDQTCIKSAIDDLRKVEEVFGGMTGKRTL